MPSKNTIGQIAESALPLVVWTLPQSCQESGREVGLAECRASLAVMSLVDLALITPRNHLVHPMRPRRGPRSTRPSSLLKKP